MLVNKDVIYKLYEEGKIRKQEDLREVFNAVFKLDFPLFRVKNQQITNNINKLFGYFL